MSNSSEPEEPDSRYDILSDKIVKKSITVAIIFTLALVAATGTNLFYSATGGVSDSQVGPRVDIEVEIEDEEETEEETEEVSEPLQTILEVWEYFAPIFSIVGTIIALDACWSYALIFLIILAVAALVYFLTKSSRKKCKKKKKRKWWQRFFCWLVKIINEIAKWVTILSAFALVVTVTICISIFLDFVLTI